MTRPLLLILLLPSRHSGSHIPTPEQAQCRVQPVMRLAMTESEQRGIVRAEQPTLNGFNRVIHDLSK